MTRTSAVLGRDEFAPGLSRFPSSETARCESGFGQVNQAHTPREAFGTSADRREKKRGAFLHGVFTPCRINH